MATNSKSNKVVVSNKKEILNRVIDLLSTKDKSLSHQLSTKDLNLVLETYFGVLLETLQVEKEAKLFDLGKLKLVATPARTAINPKTKEKILVKAKNTPKFSFSKRIKELVNEKFVG